MRHCYCASCGDRWMARYGFTAPGARKILEETTAGEPSEWARVRVGIAKLPTENLRTVRINGEPILMEIDHWDCDNCNASIHVGERAVCVSVWQPARRPAPPAWEVEYIEATA